MARKTYSIVIILITTLLIIFFSFQIERIINQRKINQTEKLFRQKFSLAENEKVAVCNYQKNWQVVSALNRLWLVSDSQIYKTDFADHKKNEYNDIPKQPNNSPLIDYYHLYQSCLW